ncbi:hypothetical protein vBSflM004_130 [Shigella phage vB_SflM_004]|nr:hypothetical protein vBSflM004_130 [Shigella phage vB_SflM_004]
MKKLLTIPLDIDRFVRGGLSKRDSLKRFFIDKRKKYLQDTKQFYIVSSKGNFLNWRITKC